jgi:ethanolamine utilization cobalamin adenosyltransferase
MKFITEAHLRDLYKKEPFTTYPLESEIRLTPGARQFLTDKGIKVSDKDPMQNSKNTEQISQSLNSKGTWSAQKLYSKLKTIEALFLTTGEELLRCDVCLAQRVVDLYKQLACIKKSLKSNGMVEPLCCIRCTGITEDNYSDNLDDCFEITDFHMGLEKGREVLMLHRLRCALQEIEPATLKELSSYEDIKFDQTVANINQIINSLSQLICSMAGVKQCQRKT